VEKLQQNLTEDKLLQHYQLWAVQFERLKQAENNQLRAKNRLSLILKRKGKVKSERNKMGPSL
jgi:hypothetical protein